jgi:hypothetical protein
MVRKLIGAVVLAMFLIGAIFAQASAERPDTPAPLPVPVETSG